MCRIDDRVRWNSNQERRPRKVQCVDANRASDRGYTGKKRAGRSTRPRTIRSSYYVAILLVRQDHSERHINCGAIPRQRKDYPLHRQIISIFCKGCRSPAPLRLLGSDNRAESLVGMRPRTGTICTFQRQPGVVSAEDTDQGRPHQTPREARVRRVDIDQEKMAKDGGDIARIKMLPTWEARRRVDRLPIFCQEPDLRMASARDVADNKGIHGEHFIAIDRCFSSTAFAATPAAKTSAPRMPATVPAAGQTFVDKDHPQRLPVALDDA